MQISTRRNFIKASSLAAAAFTIPAPLLAAKQQRPKLSFSTLGCPKWSLKEIVDFAVKHQYNGVEIRTIQGELDLTKCADFSPANINATKRLFSDNGLLITDLGASAEMHHKDETARKQNLDGAKRYIELAESLGCPYIRVFPNKLPADDTRKATLDLIAAGLNELSSHAKGSKVKVLMETHGDLVKTDELLYVIEQTSKGGAGLVWDFYNMWSITKETPAYMYSKLKKYIMHVHVKDAKTAGGKEQYVLLGTGEAPVKEAVQLLYKANFKGFYSFEWEKMWHPEIDEPEIALAQYSTEIKSYFR